MRLLVFGASGACGRWVVQGGLERGHAITAVLRPSSAYAPPDGVSTAVGDVTDRAFVASTIADHDVVLSCLGLRRASVFPWARLLSPPNLVQTFMGHAVASAMDRTLRRMIWISAGGVADSRAQVTVPIAAIIKAGNVGVAYEDLEKAESLTPGGDNRWLAVRPVTLMNGAPTGRAGEVDRYGLFSIVRRADVAAWMLDVADGTRSYERPSVLLGTI